MCPLPLRSGRREASRWLVDALANGTLRVSRYAVGGLPFVVIVAAGLVALAATTACVAAPPAIAADPDTADAWLERLEIDAERLDTLKARVRMTSLQGLLDDKTVRFGDLWYAAGADGEAGEEDAPARFAVRFDRIVLDGQMQAAEQAYVFDGRWLLDRNGREKTATRRELASADAAALTQGEGPFPIPLNLNRDRVKDRFDVELVPPGEEDPEEGGVHLRLVPREGVEMDAVRVDLWFDRATGQPLRAATVQDDGDETIVDMFEREAGAAVPAGTFDTSLPGSGGWDTQTVPLDP